ncbi:hypothetical protein [Cupriavidus sp. YAF13]|uniref:hypothetical protein n=1 Tax=Cupriavidus sp. YAF13 TaxID=3233075 RepID=UPI003F8EEFFA
MNAHYEICRGFDLKAHARHGLTGCWVGVYEAYNTAPDGAKPHIAGRVVCDGNVHPLARFATEAADEAAAVGRLEIDKMLTSD